MKNSKFEENITLQIEYFQQFCDYADGDRSHYGCYRLELTLFNDVKICNQYESLWHDFVSFRVNFFEIELKSFFLDRLACDPDEFNQFYRYFRFFRTQCGLLPVNSDNSNLLFERHFDEFKKMVSYFNDVNNKYVSKCIDNNYNELHPIYKYIVLWNGINSLLDHTVTYKRYGREITGGAWGGTFGFNDKLGHTVFNQSGETDGDDTEKKNNDNSKLFDQLCNDLEEYVIDELLQSNIFGTYLNKNGYEKEKEKEKEKKEEPTDMKTEQTKEEKEDTRIEAENKRIRQQGLKLLFGISTSDDSNKSDSWNEFKKLIGYCVQDISNVINYQMLSSKDENRHDYPIEQFIVNRLTYVIFHDLNVYHNDNINDKSMLYPNLLTLYKFLYNFSVYCICYPFECSSFSEKVNESFYLTQYFDLRDTLYRNIFNNNNDNNAQNSIKAILPRFNYFRRYCDKDGTLLHRAAFGDYAQYCEILIKNGFNVSEPNRLHSDDSKTAYQIVEESRQSSLKPLFQVKPAFCFVLYCCCMFCWKMESFGNLQKFPEISTILFVVCTVPNNTNINKNSIMAEKLVTLVTVMLLVKHHYLQ